jgi:hypothetical protein
VEIDKKRQNEKRMGASEMKSRVLYYSNKKSMKKLAAVLAQKLGTKEDVIPPAYPCDKEKLLVLGFSASKSMPDEFMRFCDGLNPSRALNVALFVNGKVENAQWIADRIAKAGANVCPAIHVCNFKLFSGVKKEDEDAISQWADDILQSLQ